MSTSLKIVVGTFICLLFCNRVWSYTWCCKSPAEYIKCTAFSERVNPTTGRRLFEFGCVEGQGTNDCVERIKRGEADIIDLDGGDLFEYKDFITLVAAENTGEEDASYYAVAVVKKGHKPYLSLENLQGATTCHTGVGKTAGWNMPIGWLYRHRDPNNYPLDEFPFVASCAPGAMDANYVDKVPGDDKRKWCALCRGDENREHICDRDHDERYYGYDGAFQCMKDGGGDIAFVKHLTVPEDQADLYQLLCPDGRRAHPRDFINCTTAKVPAHSVVMKNTRTEAQLREVYWRLRYALENIADFNTYEGKNLLWGSKTKSFIDKVGIDPVNFISRDFFCNMKAVEARKPVDDCELSFNGEKSSNN